MLYQKNIYSWESALRVIVSLAIIGYMVFAIPMSVLSYIVIAGAVGFALSGIFGWCPMCAMVGRRIKTDETVK